VVAAVVRRTPLLPLPLVPVAAAAECLPRALVQLLQGLLHSMVALLHVCCWCYCWCDLLPVLCCCFQVHLLALLLLLLAMRWKGPAKMLQTWHLGWTETA
jgi:hypothetical protein